MERNLLIREIDDLSPYRQYFWRQPSLPAKIYGKSFLASEKARIVAQIKAHCVTELNVWRGKRETDAGMYDVVKGYWISGVDIGNAEATTIISERKYDVTHNVEEIRHPWSAAFVSYIMRKAYPDFKKSRAHNRYIQWAKENRNTNAHPFQAFRVNEVAVEAGDIICFARSRKDWASYENVKGKLTHGDIVTHVQNGFANAVGGNVNKNVEEKRSKYSLDSNGYLQQEYVTIKRKSLPRFIAIIKLLPYYEKGYVVTGSGGIDDPIGHEVDREFSLPDCTTSEWRLVRDGFPKVSWDIKPKQKAKESDEKYTARKTAFVQKIHKILIKAGKNPTDWFNSFTNAKFLGQTIKNPIHIELATHLKFVEDEYVRRFGDITTAARTLGLSNSLSGGRGESATASTSMHTFGLAIDIEVHDNPYLGGDITLSSSAMKQMKKDVYVLEGTSVPRKPKKMDVLDVIFKRAGVLINGVESTYPRDHTYNTRLGLYDQLTILNALIIKYFNLVNDENAGELASLLSVHKVAEWRGRTHAEAIKLINKDYDWFRALIGRYSKETWVNKPGTKKKIKKVEGDTLMKQKGFLNLDRRLVDELGLDWGAKYGDVMHFDMRNKCIGREIYAKRK